jgi:acetate kinase
MMHGALFKRDPNFTLVKIYRKRINVSEIKFLAALAATLGGLDTLIFTAGIGENSPASRWRICEGVEFLGIHLDSSRNDANAPILSREDSPCIVRVMRTDEDLMIARHTNHLIPEKSEELKQGP